MTFQEHHYRNLERARDHLTESIVSLQSALERMTGDDWIDGTALLQEIRENIAPRMTRLRGAASERFDDHTRLHDFEAMRTGGMPFPDERVAAVVSTLLEEPIVSLVDVPVAPAVDVPALDGPNAKTGAELVAKHGTVDAAMKAYAPDSAEFDHIQAYRYVSSGKRPPGWIPPIVSDQRGDDD
jgi:hypothetical protein